MARVIQISLGERSYPIEIGNGVLERLGGLPAGRKGQVLTDSHVNALYGDRVMELLGSGWSRQVVPAGESSKSAAQWSALLEEAARSRLDRRSLLVALGGGVVGDLTGFAAAAYMRGIAFVQVPTSLLAMVDSSVGGKTGINLQAGKNLVGAFHQPIAVYADLDVLRTLPAREFAAGMAEVIKYGVALDAGFFDWLEAHAEAIRSQEPEVLEEMVARCCRLKAEIVSRDEREGSVRALLNYGHTLGHAIEQVTGYASVLHGEAVAMGMVYAMKLAGDRHGFSTEEAARVRHLLAAFGLPVQPAGDWQWSDLYAAMTADKKAAAGDVRFVLGSRIGQCELPGAVAESVCRAAWERWCADGVCE